MQKCLLTFLILLVILLSSLMPADAKAQSETLPSEISIKISVDPSIVVLGSYVTITGKISPPVSLPIKIIISGEYMWGRPNTVNSSSDGTFSYAWLPSGRGTFFVTAIWEGDQNYFASKSNTQKFKVIGGSGPFWLEVGTYLHYKHTLNGRLTYEFRGAIPMSRPGSEPPLDLAVVYEGGEFPNIAWIGPLYYVNMSSRDMLGLAHFEKQGKTPLWIDPEVSIGDTVEIYRDTYKVTGSSYVSVLGESLEAWILENPHWTLWYDKKSGILLKGTELTHPNAEYSFSILLYDTNIDLQSAIFRPIITNKAPLSVFTFKNYDAILSNVTIFNEKNEIVDIGKNATSYGFLLPYGTYFVQASIFNNGYLYVSDIIHVNLTKYTEIAISFLFGNLTILCLDIENKPLQNATILLSREDEEWMTFTDSSGLTSLEAYYGNWTVKAFWMNALVGEAEIEVNKPQVDLILQCNVGDFTIIAVDQIGYSLEANVSLRNETYNLTLSDRLYKTTGNFTFSQIPLIKYKLTITGDFDSQIYNVNTEKTRIIQIETLPLFQKIIFIIIGVVAGLAIGSLGMWVFRKTKRL